MLHQCLQGYPGAALDLAHGHVAGSNGVLDRLLGRPVAGETFEALLEDASREKWRAYVAALTAAASHEQRRRPVELTLIGPAGARVLAFAVAPAATEPGRLWLLESYRDPEHERLLEHLADAHSELARIHRELEQERVRLARALQTAEQAIATRDDVLAVVAHDLRNPLAGISMTVDLLLKTDLPPERRRRRLHGIQDAAARIHRLVRQLLEVALLEAGELSIEAAPVSAAALLREAADAVDLQAQERGVALGLELATADVLAMADRARVQRVLANLLDNALRHTPRGGSVTLRAGSAGSEVRFEVADTGSGIAPAEMRHLFQRFWQSRRDGSGTGLGLAISRGLVEAHGGRITAESTPGAGSVFSFTLPRAEPPDSGA